MSTRLAAPSAQARPAAVGYALLTLGALLWSSTSVLAKGILDTGFEVTALAQLRVTGAAICCSGSSPPPSRAHYGCVGTRY